MVVLRVCSVGKVHLRLWVKLLVAAQPLVGLSLFLVLVPQIW